MLSIALSNRSRRQFLEIGTAAIGGLVLPRMLTASAAAPLLRGKSVVVLNLQGGPTQFETFDPKMTAPREIRSITGELATSSAPS